MKDKILQSFHIKSMVRSFCFKTSTFANMIHYKLLVVCFFVVLVMPFREAAPADQASSIVNKGKYMFSCEHVLQ